MIPPLRQTLFRCCRLVAAVLSAAGLLALLSAGPACRCDAEREPHAEIAALETLEPQPAGRLVCERDSALYVTALGHREATLLTSHGAYPRWSPDGERIAFVRGNAIMEIEIDDNKARVLAEADEARAVAWHPDGNEVLFTDSGTVKAVDRHTGRIRIVVDGWNVRELDLAGGGQRLAATVKKIGYHVYAFELGSGIARRLGSGCSASLSPDGTLVTNNRSGHRKLALRDWSTGRIHGHVHAPEGITFDNHFWSNRRDWLLSLSEGERRDVYLHQVSTDRAVQLTFSGDCDRPDLYVTSGPR